MRTVALAPGEYTLPRSLVLVRTALVNVCIANEDHNLDSWHLGTGTSSEERVIFVCAAPCDAISTGRDIESKFEQKRLNDVGPDSYVARPPTERDFFATNTASLRGIHIIIIAHGSSLGRYALNLTGPWLLVMRGALLY